MLCNYSTSDFYDKAINRTNHAVKRHTHSASTLTLTSKYKRIKRRIDIVSNRCVFRGFGFILKISETSETGFEIL